MEKPQLKKLISEAGQELETISKATFSTDALGALYQELKKNEDLKNDVVLSSDIQNVTKRGGMIAKNLKSNQTAAKNALTFVDEALSKLK